MKTRHLIVLVLSLMVMVLPSCTKESYFEYDLYSIEGKWLVTSTTGKMVIGYDNIFAVNDTVRFLKDRYNHPLLYVSRPDENRYIDEDRDIQFFLCLGYFPKEDNKTFDIFFNRTHTFELIKASKKRIVFRFADNGAKATLKKEE